LAKPIIHGGAAMEYYGLRKRGADIDFIEYNKGFRACLRPDLDGREDMWRGKI
jgi:hypothetical protein